MIPSVSICDKSSRITRLRRALAPQSIAFVGGNWVEAGIRYCMQLEFAGRIAVVNPKRDVIGGLDCVPTLQDLPFVPDVAFVCVNKHLSIEIIAELRELGVDAVVCNAAGFAEIGAEGDPLQADLDRARGEMLLFGPNSPGFVNFQCRAGVAMERFGVLPAAPGVALISQGGAIMQDLIASSRDLPLTHMIGVGNQLDVSIAECIEAVLDDDNLRGIALYLEAMPEIASFSRAARMALERNIPIVAVKSGRSDAGSRAMFSHTASMTSPNQVVEAAFERMGIVSAESLPEMLETLKFLTISGVPAGGRTAIVTASGMHSALAGDAAAAAGLDVAFPSADSIAAQRRVLPDIATPGNPLDLTTYYWGEREPQANCYRALFDDAYDIALSVTNYPIPDTWDLAAWEQGFFGFADVVDELDLAAATVTLFPESFPEAAKRDHIERGIAPLQGLRESMRAIAHAVEYGRRRELILAMPAEHDGLPAMQDLSATNGSVSLDERAAKSLLREQGIAVPKSMIVQSDDAASIDPEFPGPYVVKLINRDVSHKSELGAIRLGIEDAAGIRDAMREIANAVSAAAPGLEIENYLVEQMVTGIVAEFCVGVTRIEGIGLAMTLAAGGVLTEMLADGEVLLLPASRDDIERALSRLRVTRLLTGYRGAPAANRDALVDTLLTVAEFADRHRATLLELEINPMIVDTRQAIALDAILRLDESD